MFRLSSTGFLKLTLVIVAFVARAAAAAPVMFSGELSPTDNFFQRPFSLFELSAVGTHNAYDTYGFQVTADGTYSIEATRFDGLESDTFLALYRGSFDAAAPLANLLQFEDDGGDGYLSLLIGTLQANTNYVLVFTSYRSDIFGAYTGRFDTVSGDGQVILDGVSEVPEPGTLALLPLAMLGLALARRRRSA
jgi:hypothetical protein